MNSEQRREKIISILESSDTPISASCFANEFSVTRQIIVADIALLRASGHHIRAEHKGYILEKSDGCSLLKRLVVKHGKNEVTDELYAIVDHGGKVINVIVQHSVYGKIVAELNLASRYDVDRFVNHIRETDAKPLLLLTAGLHIHTIAVKDEDSFRCILEKLAELHILVEHD
ncbi:MAG: transcription repressor NadR [Ruminococcaceae bacterium]|nr:transcription repressor NadR [Oscillospiraceae bacterium]